MKPITIIAIAALVIGAGYLVLNRNASTPIAPATASAAPMVEVTLPAQLSASAQRGEQNFNAKCASCHGLNAAGVDGKGPPLIHKIYEPGHHSDMAIMVAPFRGVPAHHWGFGDMPPVEGITEAEMNDIIRYIREVQTANGIS